MVERRVVVLDQRHGVAGAANAAAVRTAPAASRMPAPHVAGVHPDIAANGFTQALMMSRTCAGVSCGASESMSAAVPLTSGVARLVPA